MEGLITAQKILDCDWQDVFVGPHILLIGPGISLWR